MTKPEDPIAATDPAQLSAWLQAGLDGTTAVLDLTTSVNYVKRQIPGACYASRTGLAQALANILQAHRCVLTCGGSLLARYAVWIAAGLPVE